MSHHVLDERTVYAFLTNDFEVAWDCVASIPGEQGRGNFLFALQATVMLEWVSRLCTDEAALDSVSLALERVQPRYFLKMPGQARHPGFKLLNRGAPREELIAFIFDQVRNGQSHAYHQIPARLRDGKLFQVGISGAAPGNSLSKLRSGLRPRDHLTFVIQDEVGWLRLDAGMFYFEVKQAIDASGVLERHLTFPFGDFERSYDFSLDALAAALK